MKKSTNIAKAQGLFRGRSTHPRLSDRLRLPGAALFVWGALVVGLAPRSVQAQTGFDCIAPLTPAEQAPLIGQIETYYQGLQTLDGNFVQNSLTLGLNSRETSKGKVYFKKPGLMDWWYNEPEKSKQRFVSDGRTLWIYQPQIPQVMIGDFSESFSSDLPVSFLLGIGKLGDRFKLLSACRTDTGVSLKLVPQKQDASLDEFYLLVDKATHAPLGARLVDAGGNETAIEFSGVHYNSPVDASHFKFDVPRGVDVIDKRRTSRDG